MSLKGRKAELDGSLNQSSWFRHNPKEKAVHLYVCTFAYVTSLKANKGTRLHLHHLLRLLIDG